MYNFHKGSCLQRAKALLESKDDLHLRYVCLERFCRKFSFVGCSPMLLHHSKLCPKLPQSSSTRWLRR